MLISLGQKLLSPGLNLLGLHPVHCLVEFFQVYSVFGLVLKCLLDHLEFVKILYYQSLVTFGLLVLQPEGQVIFFAFLA